MFEKINRLGLGGIPLQRSTVAEVRELIEEMAKDGYGYIDSAKAYSVSEKYLGQAIVGYRDNFFIASKSMSRDKAAMAADVDDSLVKFRTDYLDLFQIHNLHTEADYLRVTAEDGAYQALLEAKAAGKIKEIGVTSHSIDFVAGLLDRMDIASVMVSYNVVEEQAETLFRQCKSRGIKTIAMKPLCGGVITDYELGLRFFNKTDCCDMVLVGMANAQEYQLNKAALAQPYGNEDQIKADELKEELGNTFCRRCGYCLPCSQGIAIPTQWIVKGYVERYGLKEWARWRYMLDAKRAADCIGCKECEQRCPYDLPIADTMAIVAEHFAD